MGGSCELGGTERFVEHDQAVRKRQVGLGPERAASDIQSGQGKLRLTRGLFRQAHLTLQIFCWLQTQKLYLFRSFTPFRQRSVSRHKVGLGITIPAFHLSYLKVLT